MNTQTNSKMRIGILTLPLHTNYGGILQAYALQTMLERMGHEVYLIEKRRLPASLPLLKMPFIYGKRILRNIMGHPFPIFYEQKINKEAPIIRQNTDRFINKYIKRKIVNKFSDIKESDFDAIVVGSDQVWRPLYFCGANKVKIDIAFLSFTKGWHIKRIAYAASFGTENWEYTANETEICKELIRHFDAISVRESSGLDLCTKHFNIKANLVLDPTMLIKTNDYLKLFKDANAPQSNGTLLTYILDETPEKNIFIQKIAKEKKLIPFKTNSKNGISKLKLQERIHPPVECWIRGFYDAKFIITDSFHACVFSILFNKPFIVIGNKDRGLSRLISLLSIFGLEDRLTTDCSIIKNRLNNIDWNKINIILNQEKEISFKFLSNALNQS